MFVDRSKKGVGRSKLASFAVGRVAGRRSGMEDQLLLGKAKLAVEETNATAMKIERS
jgi:hypothetical protein